MSPNANLQILIQAKNEAQGALAQLNRDLRESGTSSSITATNARGLMNELNKANRAERDIARLDKYIAQLGGSAEQSRSGLSRLWSGMQAMGGVNIGGFNLGSLAMAGGVAGAAALGITKIAGAAGDAAGTLQRLGTDVHRFQGETGTSAEVASGLLAVLNRYDVSASDASRGLGIFAKGLRGVMDEENGGAAAGIAFSNVIGSLGIKTLDAAGNLLPIDQVLFSVADKFKAMPDGIIKTTDAMVLFGAGMHGAGGKAWLDFLNEGGDELKALMETAKRYGVVLSQDTVDNVRKLTLAQKDLDASMAGLGVRFGTMMLPVQAAAARVTLDTAEAMDRQSAAAQRLQDRIELLVKQGYDYDTAYYMAVNQTNALKDAGGDLNKQLDSMDAGARNAAAGIGRLADIMSSADAGARNYEARLRSINSAFDHMTPAQMARIAANNDITIDGIKSQVAWNDRLAASRDRGAEGNITPQSQVDRMANDALTASLRSGTLAERDAAAAAQLLKDQREAETAASKAEAEANRQRAASLSQATSAVQALQQAMNDLNRTPLLEQGAFDAKQAKLQDRINEIDLADKILSGQRGTGAQRRTLARERAGLERQLGISNAEELVKLGPGQRSIQQMLNPALPEMSLQDLMARAAALKGGVAGAEKFQAIYQENKVSVTIDAGGRVDVQGGPAGLGEAIGEAVSQALADFMAAGAGASPGASPKLPGAR